jgi:hypothetical protein
MLFGAFVLGLVLAFISIVEAGAGHGSYLLAHLLFPWAMISESIILGSSVLALLQYPAYVVLMPTLHRKIPTWPASVSVLGLHSFAVLIAFIVSPSRFH